MINTVVQNDSYYEMTETMHLQMSITIHKDQNIELLCISYQHIYKHTYSIAILF